jgi:hypothetical protein
MKHSLGAALLATAATFALGSGAAFASTLTFDQFESSNGADKLSPVVTVTDGTGFFDVSVSQKTGSDGSLVSFAIDLAGPASFSVSDVTEDGNGLSLQTSGCSFTGGTKGAGTYCQGTSLTLGGSNTNLNGTPGLDSFTQDIVLAFAKVDEVTGDGSTLSFRITSSDLALSDFLAVGLRFQEANNREGSDKLIGVPTPPVTTPPVPLPASMWMLLAGIGGLFGFRRLRGARA